MDFFRSFGRNWFEFTDADEEGEKATYNLGDLSLSGHEKNELFRNEGGVFTKIGYVAGAASTLDGRGFVPADFDRDGDVDMLVINNKQPWLYLENRCADPSARWSVVELRGTRSNSMGIGARIVLAAGGKTQTREMHQGSGFLSSPPPEVHFGLADAARIERLEVHWPSGERQEFRDLPVDEILRIEEGGEVRVVTPEPMVTVR